MTHFSSETVNAFADPLAAVLWNARERRAVVGDTRPWTELSAHRAAAISSELYSRNRSRAPSAWKMGAFDRPTQERLVLDGPLLAPVLTDGLQLDVTEVRLELARFGQPRLEAEVGIRLTAQGDRLMPCVEIADCRFAEWTVPARAAVADFGLQGAMLFGPDVAPVPLVHVEVRRDGVRIQSADCSWDEAIGRLDIMPSSTRHNSYVATGAMTPLIPACRGRWEFDFGAVGQLSIVFF
jgi:2-keto-4-pentenoate hydratase